MNMAARGLVVAVLAVVLLLLLRVLGDEGDFPAAILKLERAVPLTANMSHLVQRDRARHGRMLRSNGAIDFPLAGNSDPFQVGLYYTRVELGTPLRSFYVQVDTGSDILWVTCSTCKICPRTTGLHNISLSFYDPGSSSSAAPLSCSDKRCRAQAVGSSCSSEQNICTYSFFYEDGSQTFGYYVKDLLNYDSVVMSSLISKSTAPIVFGCSNIVDTMMPNNVDGIFGFGRHGLSVISQLVSYGLSPSAFSHCLRGDGDGGGILVLGTIEDPNMVYSPLIASQPHYNLHLQTISVNGETLPIDESLFASSTDRGATVDSGTTLAYFPAEAYNHLMSAINVLLSTSARLVPYLSYQCYQLTTSVSSVFPQVSLYFEGGATLTLGPKDYLLPQISTDGSVIWCIAFQESQSHATILGDIVLKNKIFVYDLAGQRIGWTNYDCSTTVNVSTTVNPREGKHGNAYSTRSAPLKIILWSVITIYLFSLRFI